MHDWPIPASGTHLVSGGANVPKGEIGVVVRGGAIKVNQDRAAARPVPNEVVRLDIAVEDSVGVAVAEGEQGVPNKGQKPWQFAPVYLPCALVEIMAKC